MFPKIIHLTIKEEIYGFKRTTLDRLLPNFDSIENEAKERRSKYLKNKFANFDPDVDDEGCIEEDAYFEEINHIDIETKLKQEYLNSCAVWLFHIFEKQKKRVFQTDKSKKLKNILCKQGYDLNTCPSWEILNNQLRLAANSIKHGIQSSAFKQFSKNFPSIVKDDSVIINRQHLENYIVCLDNFWNKALTDKLI